MTTYDAGGAEASPSVSGWAIGGISFAAAMMVMLGVFEVIAGIAAIANDDFFVIGRNYTFDLDVTAWGWIHLLLGILLFLAGLALFRGRPWGGVVALVLAMLSAIANFFYIPYYPFWSVLIIAVCIWVIWSLTRPSAIAVE